MTRWCSRTPGTCSAACPAPRWSSRGPAGDREEILADLALRDLMNFGEPTALLLLSILLLRSLMTMTRPG